MFGHQNDQNDNQENHDIPEESIHGVLDDQQADAAPQTEAADTPAPDAPASDDTQLPIAPDDTGGQDWQHPGVPLDGPQQPISDVMVSPAGGFPKAPSFPVAPLPPPAPEPSFDAAPVASAFDAPAPSQDTSDASSELIDIKQHALNELSPLINELDQPPLEKFRTIMMMIQASDDQHLVKAAYEAAHSIEDEKARAQALLDIVNEINYFTQQPTTE